MPKIWPTVLRIHHPGRRVKDFRSHAVRGLGKEAFARDDMMVPNRSILFTFP